MTGGLTAWAGGGLAVYATGGTALFTIWGSRRKPANSRAPCDRATKHTTPPNATGAFARQRRNPTIGDNHDHLHDPDAGIDPRRVIPLYLGNRHARVRGAAYDAFIKKYSGCVVVVVPERAAAF